MKQITIQCHLSIGYSNANHEDEFLLEVEEGATEKEIEVQINEAVNDWANNYIDLDWKIVNTTNE